MMESRGPGPMATLSAGCSALSWRTEDGCHLWGRNLDFDRLAEGSKVTFLPRGTAYLTCSAAPARGLPEEVRHMSTYAAVGTGLFAAADMPVLYEGINEAGLMGGQLYYRGHSHFAHTLRPGTQPLQPPFAVLHLLAQCASVEEAVRMLREEITLLSIPLLGAVPPLHWSFSDRTGESVVVEPDREGLHIYRRTIGVMTNSPGYLWHRTNLLNYAGVRDLDYDALEIEGDVVEQCFSGSGAQGLPGDWSSPSRFIRLAFLKKYGVRGATEEEGVTAMLHLFQNVAFPLGMIRPSRPDPATALDRVVVPFDYTVYTAVMCAESQRFYWTTYENQRVQYVELSRLLEQGTPAQFGLDRRPDFLCRTDPRPGGSL